MAAILFTVLFDLIYQQCLVGILLSLNCHELQLSGGAFEEKSKPLSAEKVELRNHRVEADESNEELDEGHLDVELHESPAGCTVERAPGLNEDLSGAATSGQIDVADNSLTVEWHDGVLAFGQEKGLNASQGDSRRQEDGEGNKEESGGNSQEAQAREGQSSAVLVVGSIDNVLLLNVWKSDGKCNDDRKDEGGLLSGSEDDAGQEQDLALLARDDAAEEGLVGRVGDHVVSPEHVDSGQRDGGDDEHQRVAEQTESKQGAKGVGDNGVKEVVQHADAQTSPLGSPPSNATQVCHCSCDLGSDGFVLDKSDLHVGLSFGREERFLLDRRIGLVGVRRRLVLDDGGRGGRLDHGQRGHDFADGVADLCIVSAFVRTVPHRSASG